MKYALKVLVQLPDGSFQYRPIARIREGQTEVAKHTSVKDAMDWAEFILPGKLLTTEEED